MKRQAVLETKQIEVAALPCVVRRMKTDAKVGAHHQHVHVETYAKSCAQRQFLEEIADGASPKPITIIIGPITIGGINLLIHFLPKILIKIANTI